MSSLIPGDPQLVSVIVNHLKTEGLFDQFRRDCLADVDTKPAYLHLRQRVDNFVSNHLANHTWSPQLNKNQLRNSIRQLVLQSGMLEQGVDRIVAQVVDPKVHHTFRPQVERVVRKFLSPNSNAEEEEPSSLALPPPTDETHSLTPDNRNDAADSSSTNVQNQETSSSELTQEQREEEMDLSITEEEQHTSEKEEKDAETEVETEEVKQQGNEGKENSKKSSGKIKEENKETNSQKPSSVKQKTRDRLREEYSLEDSDLEGLSDITVSSVHTSDLSSFEGDTDGDSRLSESTEEGEISSEDESGQKMPSGEDSEGSKEKKPRGVRQGYIHKPFLYSRYYSDSDDEVTVEQRRRSVAKEKEERLLKRQQNRERLEEKRRQRAAQTEEQDHKKQFSVSADQNPQRPRAKEARKEKKVLEKKVALSRQRRRDSRKDVERKKNETEDLINKGLKAVCLKSSRRLSDLEELHRKKADSMNEEKPVDKIRIHSFILDLELGTEEAQRQRTAGKSECNVWKDGHSKEKERKEKESSMPEERIKPKLKAATEEKEEKKGSKVKPDRKSSVSSRESKMLVSEAVDEGNLKKARMPVDLLKEKNKPRMEKVGSKSDLKPLHRLDSTGSSEERSEVDTGSEVSRKKDKHPKENPKRSKSHPEMKPADKLKVRSDRKDSTSGERDKTIVEKSGSETDSEARKVRFLSEKHRSKSREDLKHQNPTVGKSDKKIPSQDIKSKKTEGRLSEKTKDGKVGNKVTEKKVLRETKRKLGGRESSEPKESSTIPTDAAEPLDLVQLVFPPDTSEPSADPNKVLSNITPESDGKNVVVREPCSLSAEANALLSLMTSAGDITEEAVRQETEADMKMKEAALTLLSMDPDTARSPDIIISESHVATEMNPTLLSQGQTPSPATGSVSAASAFPVGPLETEPYSLQDVTSVAGDEQKEETDKLKENKILSADTVDPAQALSTDTACPAPALSTDTDCNAQTPSRDSCEPAQINAGASTPVLSYRKDEIKSEHTLIAETTGPAPTVAAVTAKQTPIEKITEPVQMLNTDAAEPVQVHLVETVEPVQTLLVDKAESTKAPTTETDESVQNVAEAATQSVQILTTCEGKQDTADPEQTFSADPTEQTFSADPTEQTFSADPTEQTFSADPTEQTFSADPTEQTFSADPTEQTFSADPTEQTFSADPTEQTFSADPTEQAQTVSAVSQSVSDKQDKLMSATVELVKSPNVSETEPICQTLQSQVTVPDQEQMESAAARRGRSSSQRAANQTKANEEKEPVTNKEGNEEAGSAGSRTPRRGRSSRVSDASLRDTSSLSQRKEAESVIEEELQEGRKIRHSVQIKESHTVKPVMKRKRSEESSTATDSATDEMEEETKSAKQRRDDESPSEDQEVMKASDGEERKDEDLVEVKEELQRKPLCRRRTSKTCITDESEPGASEAREAGETGAKEQDQETSSRATTRAASRLEAERNKPSKPSTRALSKLGVKEEISLNTRSVRGRKHEPSPSASRTRGGQKSDDPPSKRLKR